MRKEVEQRQTVSTPMINKATIPLSAADVFAASQPNFQPAVLPVIAAALSHHAHSPLGPCTGQGLGSPGRRGR